MLVCNGQTDVTTYFVLRDSTAHAPKTDVTITDIDLYYVEDGAAISAKADATALAAADSAHADNKAFHVGQGIYRIDWPDAAFDGGIGKRVQLIVVCSGVDTTFLEVELSPPVDVKAIDSTADKATQFAAAIGTGVVSATLSDAERAAITARVLDSGPIAEGTGAFTFTTVTGTTAVYGEKRAWVVSRSALTDLNCYNKQLTAVDLSACTALATLDCSYNQLPALDITSCTSLTTLNCCNNQLIALDVVFCTALAALDCSGNQLTEYAVDAILVTLAAHAVNNGACDLSGTGNAAPSATGLAAKSTLEGRGWTVTTN